MFEFHKQLKHDAFGCIEQGFFYKDNEKLPAIRRVYTTHFLLRPLAKFLAKNEIRALKRLASLANILPYFPSLLHTDKNHHIRTFIPGCSMHKVTGDLPATFFKESKKLLLLMHKSGVVNNDLAKEANWLVTKDYRPFITDFQLAYSSRNIHGKLFLSLAYEDLRHLLKHKRKYGKLMGIEQKIISKKSMVTKIWMSTFKKLYWFVTRKILLWEERNGPEERNF